MIIYRFSVERPKDTVEVWLIRNKYSPFEFQFVNISKGYICPCKFKDFNDAIKDMIRLKSEGKIIHFERLPDFDFKPLSNRPSKVEEEVENA